MSMALFFHRSAFVFVCCCVCHVSLAMAQDDQVSDPFEPFNRTVFAFNDTVDRWVLNPVSKGYEYVTPRVVRRSVSNFFKNLRFPIRFVGSALEGDIEKVGATTARFAINSTVGVLGLFDFATDWGLPDQKTDLGIAFGKWGIGDGPYLVLPIFGPSNIRDAVGFAGELFLDPIELVRYTEMSKADKNATLIGVRAVRAVSTRSDLREAIDSAQESSVDYYLFVQSAYTQHRRSLIFENDPFANDSSGWDDEPEADPSASGAITSSTTETTQE